MFTAKDYIIGTDLKVIPVQLTVQNWVYDQVTDDYVYGWKDIYDVYELRRNLDDQEFVDWLDRVELADVHLADDTIVVVVKNYTN